MPAALPFRSCGRSILAKVSLITCLMLLDLDRRLWGRWWRCRERRDLAWRLCQFADYFRGDRGQQYHAVVLEANLKAVEEGLYVGIVARGPDRGLGAVEHCEEDV
jgi:hypothetical protein